MRGGSSAREYQQLMRKNTAGRNGAVYMVGLVYWPHIDPLTTGNECERGRVEIEEKQ